MTTLAHLGGVPEALTVLLPLALVVVMLRIGAKKMPPEDEEGAEGPAADPAPGDQAGPGAAPPGEGPR